MATDESSALTSAWNTAGTWEEKNLTNWATIRVREMLLEIKCSIPDMKGNITVPSISSVVGDASATCIRGKVKYIYDFTIVMNWKIQLENLPSSTANGTLAVSDVTADGEYEFEAVVTSCTSTVITKSMPKLIKSETSILRVAVTDVLDRLFTEMKSSFK